MCCSDINACASQPHYNVYTSIYVIHTVSTAHFTRPTISTAASRSQENRVSERLHLMSTDTGRVFDTVTSRDVNILPTQVRISSTAVPDPPYKVTLMDKLLQDVVGY